MTVFDERLYFAYGSNLHIGQMLRRCPTAKAVRRFAFKDWKLVFREVADIERCPGSEVHGALYRVTAADVAALDSYEGVKWGLYRQVNIRIKETGERGFFYVMNETTIAPPDPNYYDIIENGFLTWRIPLTTLRRALQDSFDKSAKPDIVCMDTTE